MGLPRLALSSSKELRLEVVGHGPAAQENVLTLKIYPSNQLQARDMSQECRAHTATRVREMRTGKAKELDRCVPIYVNKFCK